MYSQAHKNTKLKPFIYSAYNRLNHSNVIPKIKQEVSIVSSKLVKYSKAEDCQKGWEGHYALNQFLLLISTILNIRASDQLEPYPAGLLLAY